MLNITTVDHPALFMHVFSVTKFLAEKFQHINNLLSALREERNNFALKVLRIANETGREWRTASEIAAARNVYQVKLGNIDKKIENTQKRLALKLRNIRSKYEDKKKALDEHHTDIIQAKDDQNTRLAELERSTRTEMLMLVRSAEEDRAATQRDILQAAQREEEERLKLDINMSVRAILYRAEEESRLAHENEDVMRNIMAAKAESMRKNFEEIVVSFQGQMSMMLEHAIRQPFEVFTYSLIFAALLSSYVVITETVQAMRFYILKKLLPPKPIRHAKKGMEVGADSLQDMVLSREIRERLVAVSHAYSFCAKASPVLRRTQSTYPGPARRMPLMNVLLTGPPGTGKTMGAECIAKQSGLPYVVVCGADILSSSRTTGPLGLSVTSTSGSFLRDILDSAATANSGRGFIVIIDEADAIIASRWRADNAEVVSHDADNEVAGTINGFECIHLLLDRLRVGNPSLAVIITTSMTVDKLDAALLDRMDRIVSMGLPDAHLRLQCVVRCAVRLLSTYMDNNTQTMLKTIDMYYGREDCEYLANSSNEAVRKFLEVSTGSTVAADDLCLDCVEFAELSPETDIPPAREQTKKVKAKKQTGDESQSARERRNFNLFGCLALFARSSERWSYREIEKVIQNIQSDVLSTEICELHSSHWVHQVHFKQKGAMPSTPHSKGSPRRLTK
eukprot:CAMPEP_0185030898 /NCGR_PEP_ID=MMETSP1103-20130426/18026_1 /TAXON_ID=36769 /ORGANISM="Paraphysomonas bandaiensis, Strain Caron Lab Isolate" /LENGTH=679 /DNA_ID=CAMNT_0027566201 /DNA_START=356 /DNA_END=2395 /DNA_ORIENTATION=-